MHMKLHVWKTVGGLLFCLGTSALASAGCSSSSTPSGGPSGSSGGSSGGTVITTTINGCTADTSVDCSGGGEGFSCDAGDNPEVEDTTDSLSCSTPTANGSEDDFCCFVFTGGSSTTCTADDTITCPDSDSYGYLCADASDDPTSLDASLNCSTPVTDSDGTSSDFCCALGGTGSTSSSGGTLPTGCVADSTLSCTGDSVGYTCDAGDNPEVEDPTLSCSVPTPDGSSDDFCCFTGFTGSSTTCIADDDLTCPDSDSYGYQCADPSDDPTTLDSSLNCSDPVTDPDGTNTDFCCAFN
jgi:hypothetical protein